MGRIGKNDRHASHGQASRDCCHHQGRSFRYGFALVRLGVQHSLTSLSFHWGMTARSDPICYPDRENVMVLSFRQSPVEVMKSC